MHAHCRSSCVRYHSWTALFILIHIGGCAESDNAHVRENNTHASNKSLNTPMNSAHFFLGPRDIDIFRPGRSKTDILKDVQWRGDFGMSCKYEGNTIEGISYQFVLEQPSEHTDVGGEWLHAIFVDDKFVKFVRPPEPRAEDMEQIPYQDTTWSRPKPIKVGDLSRFVREFKGEPVDLVALARKIKTKPEAPSQIDPGLTIAYVLLRETVLRGTKVVATEEDFIKNAKLRDQFNASRLEIGMTEPEIEAVFKAKPLESGKVKGTTHSYKIYGSSEWFSIDPALHFSNVLVLFRNGKATQIRRVAAGEGWREKLKESFVDL